MFVYEIENLLFRSDKILEKRLKLMKQRGRCFEDEKTTKEEEEEDHFSSLEKIYMSEVMKQMISNGTTDSRICKSRGPFSLVSETEIEDVVDKVFTLNGKLWNVSLRRNYSILELEIFFALQLNQQYSNQSSEEEEDIQDSDYMLIDDLQRITDEYVRSVNESLRPKLLWKSFIQEVVSGVVKFNPKEKILIADIDYLKDVALLVASAEDELLGETIT